MIFIIAGLFLFTMGRNWKDSETENLKRWPVKETTFSLCKRCFYWIFTWPLQRKEKFRIISTGEKQCSDLYFRRLLLNGKSLGFAFHSLFVSASFYSFLSFSFPFILFPVNNIPSLIFPNYNLKCQPNLWQ